MSDFLLKPKAQVSYCYLLMLPCKKEKVTNQGCWNNNMSRKKSISLFPASDLFTFPALLCNLQAVKMCRIGIICILSEVPWVFPSSVRMKGIPVGAGHEAFLAAALGKLQHPFTCAYSGMLQFE